MKFLYAIPSILLCITMTACSSGLTKAQRKEMLTPPSPKEQITEYGKALDRFSAMLRAYVEPETPIILVGKTVRNDTSCQKLPMDVTPLVSTAVNHLGGNILFFPNMPQFLEFMRVHMQSNAASAAGGFFDLVLQREDIPVLVIDGALTECNENKDVVERIFDADVTGTHDGQEGSAGGSKGWTANLTGLTVDFHLVDYRAGFMIQRIQSSMAVNIKTIKGGYNFNIQVLGSGFGLNRSRKMSQGRDEAVRALVDVSILKLLGQYLLVPYWRCLEGMPPDNLVIQSLEERFRYMDEPRKIAAIQALLQNYDGYKNVRITGKLDRITRTAITNWTARHNMSAMLTPHLYSYMYINMPVDFSMPASIFVPTQQEPKVAEHPQKQTGSETEQNVAPSSKQQKKNSPPSPKVRTKKALPSLEFQTAIIYRPGKLGETVLISGGGLKSGDQYKVVVEPQQDCYLYVFQRDSSGRLFPLFPRTDRVDGLTNPVQGKIAYEFPGKGQYFYLDQQKGEEYIYFYSTAKPDMTIEKALRRLNHQLPEERKKQIEKKLLNYLMSKETITSSTAGRRLSIQGMHGQQAVVMRRVTKLGRNKLYVFPFRHQ